MVTGASSNGGLYARNGAVTLDTNNVNAGLTCPGAQAQLDPPCTFQEYVCGQTLLDNGILSLLVFFPFIKVVAKIIIKDISLLI